MSGRRILAGIFFAFLGAAEVAACPIVPTREQAAQLWHEAQEIEVRIEAEGESEALLLRLHEALERAYEASRNLTFFEELTTWDPPEKTPDQWDAEGQRVLAELRAGWRQRRPDDASPWLLELQPDATADPLLDLAERFPDSAAVALAAADRLVDLELVSAADTWLAHFLADHPEEREVWAHRFYLAQYLADPEPAALAAMVAEWLRRNPDDLQARRATLVVRALAEPDDPDLEADLSALFGLAATSPEEFHALFDGLCSEFEGGDGPSLAGRCYRGLIDLLTGEALPDWAPAARAAAREQTEDEYIGLLESELATAEPCPEAIELAFSFLEERVPSEGSQGTFIRLVGTCLELEGGAGELAPWLAARLPELAAGTLETLAQSEVPATLSLALAGELARRLAASPAQEELWQALVTLSHEEGVRGQGEAGAEEAALRAWNQALPRSERAVFSLARFLKAANRPADAVTHLLEHGDGQSREIQALLGDLATEEIPAPLRARAGGFLLRFATHTRQRARGHQLLGEAAFADRPEEALAQYQEYLDLAVRYSAGLDDRRYLELCLRLGELERLAGYLDRAYRGAVAATVTRSEFFTERLRPLELGSTAGATVEKLVALAERETVSRR